MEGLNFKSYVTLSRPKYFCQRNVHRTGEKVTALANLQQQYGAIEEIHKLLPPTWNT
jgi:hypothetical protein